MTLDQKIDKIYEMLRLERAAKKKETWVSVSFITKLTGWNNRMMTKARAQGLIEFRGSKTEGYKYKLESIPEQFLLSKDSTLSR